MGQMLGNYFSVRDSKKGTLAGDFSQKKKYICFYMSTVQDILQTHQLRRTDSRKKILQAFIDQGIALSEPEIEHLLAESESCDRVTIYRNLSTFLEKGIIHKVLDDSGAMRYALYDHPCDASSHHDHVHFKCTSCGETRCLNKVHVPEISLPEGYSFQEVNLLVKGVCASCHQ